MTPVGYRVCTNQGQQMDEQVLEQLSINPAHLLDALNQHAIVSVAAPDGTILFANDQFCAVSGYSREELLGKDHRMLNSGLHPPEFFKNMWQTIATGRRWKGIIRNRSKSGSNYWVQTTITPYCDAQGQPEYYISIRTEVTRTKQNEESLNRSSRFLRLLNDQAKALLVVGQDFLAEEFYKIMGAWSSALGAEFAILVEMDAEHHELRLVHQYPQELPYLKAEFDRLPRWTGNRRSSGKERSRLILDRGVDLSFSGEDVANLLHRWGFNAIISVPVKFHTSIRYAMKFLARDKQTFAPVSGQLFFIDILSDLLSSAYQRVHNERELQQQKQKLDARQFLAHLGDWDMEVSTLRVKWSPALFGFSEALTAISLSEFVDLVHPEDRRMLLNELNTAINHSVPTSFEFRLVGEDNSQHWVQMRGARIRDKDQHTDLLIATLIDVSHIKSTEAELREAKKQADQANTAKSQFLSNMSHELRTPLNSILGFGQLLELDDTLDMAQQENVQAILSAGAHLLNLINEILDLSVVEAGAVNIVLERSRLATIVDECVALVGPISKRYGVTLEVEPLPDVELYVDRMRFKQAVINLLSNAIKYNKPDGHVWVRCELPNLQHARLNVIDTGLGISPEKKHELFKPFSRLGHENSTTEGTGIGLTFTKSVVELMGGDIGFTSSPGNGSTFYLEFPLAAYPMQGQAPPAGEPRPTPSPQQHDQVLMVSRGFTEESMVRSALSYDTKLSFRIVEPDHDLNRLATRIRPNILLVNLGDLEDPWVDEAYLERISALFGTPRMIALLDANAVKLLQPYHTRFFDYICLLPIDRSAIQTVLQSVSYRASLQWA